MNLFSDELLLKAAERRQLFSENSSSPNKPVIHVRLFIQYTQLIHTR